MRYATIVAFGVAIALLGGARSAGAQFGTNWQGFANAWIASHAQRAHGKAPRETRKSCEGDLNGDAHDDVVIVYTIEAVGGGDDWTQYVTVMTSTPQGYGASMPKAIGGKTVRTVESCKVAGTSVEFAYKIHGPTDPPCCPSAPGVARLRFEQGALVDEPVPSPSGP